MRTRTISIVGIAASTLLVVTGCKGAGSGSADGSVGGDRSSSAGGGVGAPCASANECRSDLVCRDGTCEPIPLGTEGTPCTYTAECMVNLYCGRARLCVPSGGSGLGDPCVATADCQMGLVCVGGTCRSAGPGDVGAACTDDAGCVAGLFCVDGTCSATSPATDGGADGGLVDGGGHMCMASGDCDDHDACTIDSCIADHCVQTLTDVDMDGYAPSEIGACGLDCNDNDPTVNPDHTAFMATRQSGSVTHPPSFDWNCDGVEEKQWPNPLPTCDSTVGSCGGEGWIGAVPACGDRGDYGRCTASCTVEAIESGRVQTCR